MECSRLNQNSNKNIWVFHTVQSFINSPSPANDLKFIIINKHFFHCFCLWTWNLGKCHKLSKETKERCCTKYIKVKAKVCVYSTLTMCLCMPNEVSYCIPCVQQKNEDTIWNTWSEMLCFSNEMESMGNTYIGVCK